LDQIKRGNQVGQILIHAIVQTKCYKGLCYWHCHNWEEEIALLSNYLSYENTQLSRLPSDPENWAHLSFYLPKPEGLVIWGLDLIKLNRPDGSPISIERLTSGHSYPSKRMFLL
jgi:hypothetical protein